MTKRINGLSSGRKLLQHLLSSYIELITHFTDTAQNKLSANNFKINYAIRKGRKFRKQSQ